jgi:hypothetical protein
MNNESKELHFDAKQVVYLLQQAADGHHVLFEKETIRQALESQVVPPREGEPLLGRIQGIVAHLADLTSLGEQQAFIRELPERVQYLMIKLYFRFLDQYMQRNEVTLH